MRRAGMTLIELVVGLTIASMVLGGAYAGLATALDRREAAVAELELDLQAAATRSSLRSWLEGTRIVSESTAPVFSGADGTYDGLPDDQILFLTSAPTPLGVGLSTVRLFVDRDPETPQTGLVAEFGAWLGTRRLRLEVAPQVIGLDVRYHSTLLSGRSWHPSWISTSVLPAGVELSLVAAEDAELHPLLRPPLRVALQGGR